MSKLWEFFIQDDVESFQRLLASPDPKGTRSDVNARDHHGRTLLHHVASSPKPTAINFARALLEAYPSLDIYAQDWESGWTALHRALYAGNASVARALVIRDNESDFARLGNSKSIHQQSGTLIKIKDREGYSPFDVYGATITSRDIKQILSKFPGDLENDTASNAASLHEEEEDDGSFLRVIARSIGADFSADEIFTFGSNKNLNLGLGDQDDRQFPERIAIQRPDHLLNRFHREYQDRMESLGMEDLINTNSSDELPTIIANKPMKFRNVVMSKLHTAIMTDDPEANLFMCGFGPGGRLGTGDESTRFDFVCIEGGGLAGKAVVSVALGQDHSLAITNTGEIFSWGSNTFGQLGYNLPRTSNRNDVPIQTTPRQIFNAFKRERIMGAAASAIHSVVFSDSGLYTFGKNEGQLGLVDSDARSLEVQITPRRVGASLFQCPIQTASAIDRATAVLLQNHEVWVFSQYGYSKLSFPLEASSSFIRESFMATRYDHSVNHVVKLASGGSTICALSSSGEVFTVEVNKTENSETSTSTTNPAKIRNSLASPLRAWSVKKSHMAASDVDVGQDGSIIICTTSGTAWRKEKRTKSKDGSSKDYKFARIPGLSRAVAVRSNAFGAYSVAQRDCDVTREQVHIGRSTLWDDLLPLSPFLTPGVEEIDSVLANDVTDDPVPLPAGAIIKRALILSPDIESQFLSFQTSGTIWVTTSDSEQRIPAHQFLLAGRSAVLRKALQEFREAYYSSVPDLLDIEYGKDGQTEIKFRGVDFLTVMNLVFFLYTDGILDVWHLAKTSTKNAARYRQVRNEVMRVGTQLALPTLERAARLMVEPQRSLKKDMAHAISNASFFDDADVIVQLKGGSLKVHSQVICQRCPFFEALFHGRSGGRWLESRRSSEKVNVDLKHIDRSIFDFVLRYIYSDADEHLFDQVRVKTIDDLIDLFLDVMYVANELMIDRLSQICQNMIGRFVNTRNISYLLNSAAPIYMTEFKEAALEYICLDLETMLANKYLDLDDDLLGDLDLVCHENQLACFPISRGRNSEGYVLEKYPEIVSSLETDKRRRIDAMALQTRLDHRESDDMRPRQTAGDKTPSSARKGKSSTPRVLHSSAASPMLKPRQSSSDLMFQMDEETGSTGDLSKGKAALRGVSLTDSPYPNSPALGASIPESMEERSFLDAQMSSPREKENLLAESPTESRAIALHQRRSLGSPSRSSVPWGSPVIPSGKKDLKDIMGETSQSRVSNLTLGMSSPRESSRKSTQKVSQRDRKKIQQQQMQEMLAAQENAKEASQNPWQLPPPATPGTPTKDPLPGQKVASPPVSDQKPAQRPSMTMRQTIAGTPPPTRSKPVATPAQAQSRSVSANIQTSVSRPSPSSHNSLPKPSPQLPVHSIRHIPRPDPHAASGSPSVGSFSLASILHQQQTEKDEIREAANAKHNLDEIQAEQEFQQWWDQESKRIQGLLDPEPSQPEQQQKNQQRGSGKSGRGGKGPGPGPGTSSNSRKRRGNKTSVPEANSSLGQNQAQPTPKKNVPGHGSTQPRDTPAGNHAAGKNPRRGGQRGRGKDRGNQA